MIASDSAKAIIPGATIQPALLYVSAPLSSVPRSARAHKILGPLHYEFPLRYTLCSHAATKIHSTGTSPRLLGFLKLFRLESGPMPNLMVALPNIGGALCSTPQSLADAHY